MTYTKHTDNIQKYVEITFSTYIKHTNYNTTYISTYKKSIKHTDNIHFGIQL